MRAAILFLLAWMAFGVVGAVPASGDASPRPVAERWAALANADLSGYANSNERARAVERVYQTLFADDETRWRHASDSDLDLYFQAASFVAFYSMRVGDVARMERLLGVLNDRKLAQPRHYADMYGALLSIRSFDRARTLLDAHPGLAVAPLPTVVMESAEGAAGTVWRYSQDQAAITLTRATLSPHVQVIVIAHPLCHFTQDAARSITSDPQLRAALDGALWLAPQSWSLDVSAIQDWNRKYPTMQIYTVNRRSDWPSLENWGTPTFYFLRDGKVVETVVGWPREGRSAQVLGASRRMRSPVSNDHASGE